MTGFNWYPHGTILFKNSYAGLTPTAPTTASTGTFHYIAFVRDGNNMNVYLDGVAGTPVSGWSTSPEQWKGLGWDGGANVSFNSFNGTLDEVFYSNVVRSGDYITARFNNLTTPQTFYSVGSYTAATVAPPSTTRTNSQVSIFF
jgi:hypothetical protein